MSHLRVVISRVEDEGKPDKVTELHRFDLPGVDPEKMEPETALDGLENRALDFGRLITRRLLEYQWVEVDELLTENYQQAFPPSDGDS